VVDQFIADMEGEFGGKETPLNKSRGKVHDYLGMTLDFPKIYEPISRGAIRYNPNLPTHFESTVRTQMAYG
jgi:hypothetical protein